MSNESREEDRVRFLADKEKRQHIVNHLKFADNHKEFGLPSNLTSGLKGTNFTLNSSHWMFLDHVHKIDPMLLEIKNTIWESNKRQIVFNLDKCA